MKVRWSVTPGITRQAPCSSGTLIVNRTKEWLARNGSLKSFLFMSVGRDETEIMKAGCESMKSLLQQQTNNLTWSLDYTPNAAHNNNAFLSIPRALRKWANHMSEPVGVPGQRRP
jgi:hypothetical protein